MKEKRKQSVDHLAEQISALIKQAFAEVPFPFHDANLEWQPLVQLLRMSYGEQPYPYQQVNPEVRLDHGRFYKWYFDLSLFIPEVFQYVLPRLMVRLLNERANEAEYAEYVINRLNVPSALSSDKREAIQESDEYHVVRRLQDMQHEVAEQKKESHVLFTHDQIQAVLKWLLFVRDWQELDWQVDDISAAINYWQKLSKDIRT